MSDDELKAELRRIAESAYDHKDSERNHQAFAASHLRTQERLDAIEKILREAL